MYSTGGNIQHNWKTRLNIIVGNQAVRNKHGQEKNHSNTPGELGLVGVTSQQEN